MCIICCDTSLVEHVIATSFSPSINTGDLLFEFKKTIRRLCNTIKDMRMLENIFDFVKSVESFDKSVQVSSNTKLI